MKKLYLVILLLAGISIRAQEINESYYQSESSDTLISKSLEFKISNNNFLKNNEYFNRFTEGITWFGSSLQPEIRYAFSSKTRISAGWFLRYYYGRSDFNTSLPVFRFEYDFAPGFRLCFGQLSGQLDHRLIEPIYSTDNYFSRNPEYGIQFHVNKPAVRTDLWISWDHFILPGEDRQEEITGGINACIPVYTITPGSKLAFNIQGIIHHFGGQVDQSDNPLQTRLNLAPGLEYSLKPASLLSDFRVGSYFIQAADQSGNVTIPYKKGVASYTYAMASARWFTLAAAYFHGEYYFAPLGDYLFQSVSELNNWYNRDKRNLLNGKLMIDREITNGVKLGIQFESYYDLDKGNLDYSYGLNIKADARWLLRSDKKTH